MKVIADTGKRDSWSLQHNRIAHVARLADEKAEKAKRRGGDETTEPEFDPVEAVHSARRRY